MIDIDETKVRVLIVEDDPDVSGALADLLEIDGYRVDTAPTIGQAKRAALACPPAIALLDVNLGRDCGLDLVPWLRAEIPGVVSIALTADTAIELPVRALRLGADDYLLKPVDIEDLSLILDRHLTRRRHETEFRVAQRRFRALFDHASQLLFLLDRHGILLEANDAAIAFASCAKEDSIGQHLWDTPWWSTVRNREQTLKPALGRARAGETVSFEVRVPGPDRQLLTLEYSIKPVPNENEVVDLIICEGRDITERKAFEQKIIELARHDSLTGLANRGTFHDHLELVLAHARRAETLVAILCIDLDHFKAVNDTLGHPAGDRLLQVIAGRLTDCTRASDTVARLGGDEFAILATDLKTLDQIKLLAARIIERCSRPLEVQDHDLRPGLSIGIAVFPVDHEDPEELLKAADSALYDAKRSGRNAFQLFDERAVVEAKAIEPTRLAGTPWPAATASMTWRTEP